MTIMHSNIKIIITLFIAICENISGRVNISRRVLTLLYRRQVLVMLT